MEILSSIPNSVTNWEPLHRVKGVIPKSINWGFRVFIPPKDNNENYLKLITKILTLKTVSNWTLSKNSFSDIKNSKFVITKFIQGNMLLPWITEQLDFNYKPIYLLRHPISTSLSQIKAFGNDEIPLKKFDLPDSINNDRFEEHLEYVNSLKTHLQRQVCLWCINNKYVLDFNKNNKKWMVVYYENLVSNPEKEILLILETYGLKELIDYFDFNNFGVPSKTDFKKDFINDPKQQIEKFINRIEQSELLNIQNILDYFDITCYSAFSAYPINK